ncbi:MAG: hypothetical protein S4CHLAM45_06560 [Chlamydiales bacterium]|nr:hypothetical protein [Chlamydiales bacterium]MCH9620321.1 hypothetical protein [Chlamydiales bacterium]MCH9622768.1 hypothetical protein [Chlamydiales bacterium]
MSHTVIVILEAKAGKENELKESLLKIAELSRQEASCITYHLYQDPDNLSQFGLYEQWKNKDLHQEQFKKPYIIEFSDKAESLLAKPYQGFFGKELFCEEVEKK